tara:strand:+ start:745 stop:1056 length:312 start_codon:yes stop_codon:yes gene_type:complete
MKNQVYDFYLRRDEEEPAYKLFRGTLADFRKVENLYEELRAKVIDSHLGIQDYNILEETLSDDPILLQWEGGEIIAENITTHEQHWYYGNGVLNAIGTEVINR